MSVHGPTNQSSVTHSLSFIEGFRVNALLLMEGISVLPWQLPSRLMTSPFSGPMICVTLKDHLQRSFQAWLRRCQALSSSHSSLPSEGSSDSSSSLSNSVADLHLRPLCSSSSKPIHPLPKFLTGNHAFQVSVARLSKEATAEVGDW